MKVVALVRNINVGQKGFPNRGQLLQAFLAAGAFSAVSFQSNGTVVAQVEQEMHLELLRDGAGGVQRGEGDPGCVRLPDAAAGEAAAGAGDDTQLDDAGAVSGKVLKNL